MIILGVDPGYGRTGYAVIEKINNAENLLDYGCIETLVNEDYFKRLLMLGEKIEKIITKHKPDVLAIEKIFFSKNQKTAIKVAEAKGIIAYVALKNGVKDIEEYAPSEVKTIICGYGSATKNQVKKMVCLILKISKNIKPDDTIDAIALCLCYMNKNRYN